MKSRVEADGKTPSQEPPRPAPVVRCVETARLRGHADVVLIVSVVRAPPASVKLPRARRTSRRSAFTLDLDTTMLKTFTEPVQRVSLAGQVTVTRIV